VPGLLLALRIGRPVEEVLALSPELFATYIEELQDGKEQ
jgi:hypothetical protein